MTKGSTHRNANNGACSECQGLWQLTPGAGKSYTMYHGTSAASAAAIQSGGFHPSLTGMLGAGVYLSKDVRKAKAYGPVVLSCTVDVGKVKCIDRQGHPFQKSWHDAGYDTLLRCSSEVMSIGARQGHQQSNAAKRHRTTHLQGVLLRRLLRGAHCLPEKCTYQHATPSRLVACMHIAHVSDLLL